MIETVWVYKDDDTLQCGWGQETSLAEMQKELESLGAKVINSEKRQDCRIINRQCGLPTGQVNAYEISMADWQLLCSGFVGKNGFRLWTCGEESILTMGGEVPWPLVSMMREITSVGATPTLIRDLIGKRCRVYHQGDILTKDYIKDRVNIELNEKDIITDIWFG